ncbi:MAG: hypothetical protein RBU25_11585, partial [Lentisphaeria bacterium]|nr:hypothetical protein [Lentisphaeria bacterium]
MTKNREWYLSWKPGSVGCDRDDILLAVGVRCARSAIPLQDVLSWLGVPDRVTGDRAAGHLAYFFDQDRKSAAYFDVAADQVNRFGTIMRHTPNARRPDNATGRDIDFNIQDEKGVFVGSEMAAD